jgi:hypothetical protein
MKVTQTLTDQKLRSAYVLIAEIVTAHGEVYLPIFKRIHDEVEARKANRDLLSIASAIAN